MQLHNYERVGWEIDRSGEGFINRDGRRWKTGDPIEAPGKFGQVPRWSTVRSRYWKNRAFYAKEGEFDDMTIERMKAGKAPQRWNAAEGRWESKELHHIPPQREGGLFDFIELWLDEHIRNDPFRH